MLASANVTLQNSNYICMHKRTLQDLGTQVQSSLHNQAQDFEMLGTKRTDM